MARQISNSSSTPLHLAAQYLRVSTDHQRYSIANQSVAVALYAANHNIGIIRSFADEGKSGTTISGRYGLQELLQYVESGKADFEMILVYDISRWGRFPDADEAAHYEYLCRRAGIEVCYCAEEFENNNSPASNMLKAIKRTMAAEFSRELSSKVLTGQRRLVELGFRMGPAPYALQRLLLDEQGKLKQVLRPGQCKALQTDRTILAPGDKEEVRIVNRIFDLFTKGGKTSREIVNILNREAVPFHGRSWGPASVSYVLQNPAYAGTNAYCRWRPRGEHLREANPKNKWVIREGAFPAIIVPDQFHAAQEIIAAQKHRFSKAGMLDALRKLWVKHGTLSTRIIRHAEGMPDAATYWRRFGGLNQAYQLIGFQPKRDSSYASAGHAFPARRAEIHRDLAAQIQAVGGSVMPDSFDSIRINDGITVRVMFCRSRVWRDGRTLWALTLNHKRIMDVVIAVRLQPFAPFAICDYYVIPKGAELRGYFHILERNNAAYIDLYHTDTLRPFIEACARKPVPVSQ